MAGVRYKSQVDSLRPFTYCLLPTTCYLLPATSGGFSGQITNKVFGSGSQVENVTFIQREVNQTVDVYTIGQTIAAVEVRTEIRTRLMEMTYSVASNESISRLISEELAGKTIEELIKSGYEQLVTPVY